MSAFLQTQIQNSLNANVACQKEIEIRLRKIMLQKKRNRQKAIQIMHHISLIMSAKSTYSDNILKGAKTCDYNSFRELLLKRELKHKQNNPNETEMVLKRKRNTKVRIYNCWNKNSFFFAASSCIY